MNEQQLLRYIDQVSFALLDVTLYLDTHPCDKEALAYYKEIKELRKESIDKYQHSFGPLQIDCVNGCDWSWVSTPWPWE